MARIIPPQCPPETASLAERELFSALRDGLDRHYTVIHSLPWLSDEQRRLREGECDFLVLHPQHGMLALETKTGELRYDGRSRCWVQGESHVVDDPFTQAERSAHAIHRMLGERLPGWRQAGVPFGYAVALPDADRLRGAFPSHVRPELLILRPELPRLAGRIEEILGHFRRAPSAPDAALVARAVDLLLPSFGVIRSLASQVAEQDQALFRLTEQQCAFFESLQSNRRMVVEGVAGSGKTILARETAARLHAQGHRVLLLCFNIPLADLLRAELRSLAPGVDVCHFHGLCERIVTQAGGRFEVPSAGVDVFYNETAPELLIQALPTSPVRYSAILVDEAQDFCDLWWIPIEDLLADRVSGYFYLFLDRRQDIYRRSGRLPFSEPAIALRQNCRNTAGIARLVHGLGQVAARVPPWVPEGVDPEVTEVASDEAERDAVRRLLHRLVNEQGLRPEQIVILGAHRFGNSIFKDRPLLGRFTVVDRLAGSGPAEVRYSTLHRFKGLESDCVILTGVGGGGWATEAGLLREQLYVAASRAKSLLHIYHRPGLSLGDLAPAGR